MGLRASSDARYLVAIVIQLLIARIAAYLIFPVYDDAFITFRYAANLAAGAGFVYHAGEWVLGTTAPAFGLLLTPLLAAGADPENVVPLINIVLDVLIAALTVHLLMTRIGKLSAILFGLLYAAMPLVGRITVGGMEANTFLLACVVGTHLFVSGRQVIAVMLASIAFFLRPEAVLMVGILVLAETKMEGIARGLRLGLIAIATVAPGLVFEFWFYGQVLPQSAIAKSTLDVPRLEVIRALIVPEPISMLLVAFTAVGFILSVRRRDQWLTLIGAFVVLYSAAYLARAPKPWSWYALPIQYGIALYASFALEWLATRIVAPSPKLVVRASAAFGILIALQWTALSWWLWPDRTTRNVYKPLAAWCTEHIKAEATFLASDIGIIGFRCLNNRIYDTAGLVWPEMLALGTQTAVIEKYRPDYLFLNANDPVFLNASKVAAVTSYEPIARFSKEGHRELHMPPENMSLDWIQDYVILRRVR